MGANPAPPSHHSHTRHRSRYWPWRPPLAPSSAGAGRSAGSTAKAEGQRPETPEGSGGALYVQDIRSLPPGLIWTSLLTYRRITRDVSSDCGTKHGRRLPSFPHLEGFSAQFCWHISTQITSPHCAKRDRAPPSTTFATPPRTLSPSPPRMNQRPAAEHASQTNPIVLSLH